VLAAGAGALLCVTAGNRPDLPPAAAGPGSPSANGGEDDADPDGG
jgi:hypothetical protein